MDLNKLIEKTLGDIFANDKPFKEYYESSIKLKAKFSDIAYLLNNEFNELYRKKEDLKIDIRTIESHIYKFPKITDKFLSDFAEYLNSKENYFLADFELNGFFIEAIDYKPFKTKFECSGKVILENDLRDFFNDCDFDINSRRGIVETMQHFSDQGMLHGFVGNSCPSFILNKEKGEIIVGVDYDNETDEKIVPEGFEQWGSVCTDLWWYSMVDYEKFKEISKLSDEEIEKEYTVLELEKGTWELEHYYGISSKEYHEIPYAKLRKLC